MKKILIAALALGATAGMPGTPMASEVALCYQPAGGGMAPPPLAEERELNGVFDEGVRVPPPPPPPPPMGGFGKLKPTDRLECYLHEDTQPRSVSLVELTAQGWEAEDIAPSPHGFVVMLVRDHPAAASTTEKAPRRDAERVHPAPPIRR